MRAILIRSLVFCSTLVGLLTAAGCSSSSGSSPAPASPTTPSTTSLSAAFSTNCSSCHGKDGSTKFGSKNVALKASTVFTTASWEAAVRNGKGNMPPFETADYSDVAMKADYKVLTSKTWQ